MSYSRRQLEAFGEPFGDSCTRVEPGRHLICGGGGKGGGSSTNTVQKADPWKKVQPYLEQLYPVAQEWFNSPSPQFFPESTVAGQAPETLMGQEGIAQRALMGSPLQSGAQAVGYRTLAGDYLGANPFLNSMFQAATDPFVEQFSRATLPGITSQFAAGGRYGSEAHQAAVQGAEGKLGQALGAMGANIYGPAYEAERQRQQQMIGMAPQLAQMDYNDLNMLMGIGGQREAREQELLNADIARWDFGQNQPLSKIQAYNQLLMGGGGLGGQSSMTTGGGGGSGSPLGGALGGAMLGYQALPMLASTGMLGSTAAASGMMGGAGMTALGGLSTGGLGLLAGAILGGLLGG